MAGDISVEFFKQQKGDGRNQGDPYIPELDIAPLALPYLNILLDMPLTPTFRGLGKITVHVHAGLHGPQVDRGQQTA